MSVDIRVLYRVGLDDQSAQRVPCMGWSRRTRWCGRLAGRLLAEFFADRTLTDVLGARRELVATGLRDALQTQLDAQRSGIEVVAVAVESMHPPGGAAAAYRSVQAAEITASMQRAQEDRAGARHAQRSGARRA